MKSYVTARAFPGQYAATTEINAELADVVAAMHRLDRDNLGEPLTHGKVELGAFGKLKLSQSEQLITVLHPPNNLDDESTDMYPLPFDLSAGEPIYWVVDFESGDCELEISLGVGWVDDFDELEHWLWIGVRVDGVLVARSPTQAEFTFGSAAQVTVNHPVSAGVHIIEPVYGRAYDASERWVSFTDRTLSVLEIAR
jgi:hypothetical protein